METLTSWRRQGAERRAKERAKERAKAVSDGIDVQIEEESRNLKRQINILLIGNNDTEASTVIKQMKFTHCGGYTHDELAYFRLIIWKSLLENSRNIVQVLRAFDLEPTNHANKAKCEYIMNHRTDTNNPEFSFLPEFAQAVQDLWADEIITELLECPSDLSFDDDAAYFFIQAQRIAAEEYVPSTEDVLRAADHRTASVTETYFNFGQLSIRISQVKHQQNVQWKWIHHFEGVTSIIFCASLSDYDQEVIGEDQQTLLAESLSIFKSVVNSRWFLRTSIILLLTGIDKFKAKLDKVPLDKYFPEYMGGADVSKGAKYILWRFMQVNRARLHVYPHITQDPDPSTIRLIFTCVKETILQNALKDSGILE
ncbi:G-protein alpha subunit [Lactifluus subvellereus]|nr:G-protein alpha subunit [Lactifluus subvellereus]